MSHTERIYNNAKKWYHNKVAEGINGYLDYYFTRRFHPFKQESPKCHCEHCFPKGDEPGALRIKRKKEIDIELNAELSDDLLYKDTE